MTGKLKTILSGVTFWSVLVFPLILMCIVLIFLLITNVNAGLSAILLLGGGATVCALFSIGLASIYFDIRSDHREIEKQRKQRHAK